MLSVKHKFLIYYFLLSFTITYGQNNSRSASYYHDLALSQLIDNKLDDALNNINTSINIDPYKSSSYYIKGIVYQRKELHYVAIDNFKQAIKLDPSNPDFYIKTAYSFNKVNRIQEACDYLEEACVLGNSHACEAVRQFCPVEVNNVEYEIKTDKSTNYNKPFNVEDLIQNKNNTTDPFVQKIRDSYNSINQPSTHVKGGFYDTFLNPKVTFASDFSDKTLYDTHTKLNDGTWIPKYETYSPNRDNYTVPNNRIDYDRKNKDLFVFVLTIVTILLLVILALFLTKRKAKNNKRIIKNSTDSLPTDKKDSANLNAKLYFTKYKLTEEMFYKSNDCYMIINSETIIVSCFPIFEFSGTYYIKKTLNNNTFNIIRFIVFYDDPETGFPFTIDIEKGGKKVSVYQDNLVGIIFKA